MANTRAVGLILGVVLISLAFLMLIPAIADLIAETGDWESFVLAAVITGFAGGALVLSNYTRITALGQREAFLVTTLAWTAVCVFSSLPFALSEFEMRYVDALFEAVSGFTTTGATVLVGLDEAPHGLLLWRSLLQWMGGLGIIVTAVAILPFLRVGGMQLFRTESSDRSDKVLPRPSQIARAIGEIYLLLTMLCALGYSAFGMTPFDALNHAMTTVSTAGFSTHDDSFGHFTSLGANWIAITFMLAGGVPLILYVQTLRGMPETIWRDRQVQAFLLFVFGISIPLGLWVWSEGLFTGGEAITHATFNVVSYVTTTGYSSDNFALWGPLADMVFFLLLFTGGCTGSTSGGIKAFRYQILLLLVRSQIRQTLYPHLAQPLRYGERKVTQDVVFSIALFLFIYMCTVAILAICLAAMGIDFITAVSSAATAVGNVGPGIGDVVGPAGTFHPLPDAAKYLLSIGMLMGRLELLTVIVMLSRDFWET